MLKQLVQFGNRCIFAGKHLQGFCAAFGSRNMSSKYQYDCTAQVVSDGNTKITKYKSKNSGMTICIGEVHGPLVGGYLTFATEAFDDDGLPHTLEHLVFLGSEKYPYKGVLDMIANKCLSSGTNAWTDTDHTCYTVTTGGEECFLTILPIYLDHLLFPTLSDSAFATEVHHINGEGEDAGVVYCEMQGRENSGESRCYLAMLRAMYPGHCGYKSETGGLVKNLRESTTNEKVRAYHKEFYRPENLSVIIAGPVEASKVFEALIPVEDRIAQEVDRKQFVRPWQSPVPPLEKSEILNIEYPTDEEEFGIVISAWRGPLANDFLTVTALQILMDYFTDTSVAPLNRDFVEVEDPICNDIDYSLIENSVTCLYMHFSSVPVKRLNECQEKLFAFMQDMVDGKESIDMTRLTTLIKKKKLYILSSMESSPHSLVSNWLIGDFLYGSTIEDLEHRVKEISLIDKLFDKDVNFWIALLKTYIVDGNHIVVLGHPSQALSEKMANDEKERIKQQQEKLGPDGLKEKAAILKSAIAENEVPPPKEVLSSIKTPSVKSIKFHPIKRTCNAREYEGDDIQYSTNKMPCRFQLDHIQTNFVRVFVLLDTSHLSVESRMYLPLLIELLDECAIKRNGEIVQYQDVVKQLAEDTITISSSLGFHYNRFFCTSYAQTVCLSLMVEEDKYVRSVQWIREILYQIFIEPSRIKSTVNKMITDVPSVKRSGSAVIKSMTKNMIFRPDSNHWTASVFRQYAFLNKLLNKLETEPEEIVSKLNEIRDSITKPDKMIIHMALNLDNMRKKVEPEEAWQQEFLPSTLSPGFRDCPVKKCSEYLQSFAGGDGTKALIVGVKSIESSFLQLFTPCSISRGHPDFAPLLVLNNYLTQCEGPMWRQIRGCGLAYSYGISINTDTGLMHFILYKANHPVKAFKEAVNIVDSHLNGTIKWDLEQLECARFSLMSEKIEAVKTIAGVVVQSLKAYCRNVDDFNKELQELLEKITRVTTSDMERVGMQYLKNLFNPEISRCAVTCNPSKVKDIVEEMKKLNIELTEVPSLDESFMSQY